MTTELHTVIDAVLNDLPTGRRVLVAIDGVDGSGKSTFAAALADQVTGRSVVVIHLDDFLNPANVRHRRGRDSPEGFWLDSYDYAAFKSFVMDPLRTAGSGAYRRASFDAAGDAVVPAPVECAATDAVILVEGMFLHRDEFVGLWDRSVFLDVAFTETARRMAVRDGSNPDPEHESMRRYVQGQRLYFRSAAPWARADVVIDNTTPDRPRIIDPTEATGVR